MTHLENSKIALARWMTVPPENVYPGLYGWNDDPSAAAHCGTLACFGGWVALMPEFVEMGVKKLPSGAPYFEGDELKGFGITSIKLFGENLFNSRDRRSSENHSTKNLTDHGLVKWRLEANIKRLEKKS